MNLRLPLDNTVALIFSLELKIFLPGFINPFLKVYKKEPFLEELASGTLSMLEVSMGSILIILFFAACIYIGLLSIPINFLPSFLQTAPVVPVPKMDPKLCPLSLLRLI